MKPRSFRRFSTYCLSLGLSALGLGTRLHAGNLEKFALGEDAGLSAGAVVAMTADSGSLYYNPAGLALLDKDSVDLGVSAYAARYYRVPRLVQITLPDREVAMDFEGTSFFSTPAAVVFGGRLQPGLGWALGFYTRDQLDLSGRISETFEGTFAGNRPYEFEQGMELDFRFKNYLGGGGLGWQAAPGLRLGLSALGEYIQQSIRTHFWWDFYDPSTQISPGQYGVHFTNSQQSQVGIAAYGARALVGAQWDALPGLTLGLVGRSPRFTLYVEMQQDILFNGSFYEQYTPSTFIGSAHINGDGAAHPYVWEDPWRVESSLAWNGRLGWLAAQVDASDRPDDEGRGTVFNYKLGGLLHLSPEWDLGGGAYTDLSWKEELRDFANSNTDYYGFNGGLRWKRLIGGSDGRPGTVELRTSLILHYERGYGPLLGARSNVLSTSQPGAAITHAVFEEANAHLASGLAW